LLSKSTNKLLVN